MIESSGQLVVNPKTVAYGSLPARIFMYSFVPANSSVKSVAAGSSFECAAPGRAPSGANHQPWHFCLVGDPVVKKDIRAAAEEEERAFYDGRASDEWLEALAPIGTDPNKPFLETAPWLIAVFAQRRGGGEGLLLQRPVNVLDDDADSFDAVADATRAAGTPIASSRPVSSMSSKTGCRVLST